MKNRLRINTIQANIIILGDKHTRQMVLSAWFVCRFKDER